MEPCILCSFVVRHYQIAEVVFSNYCGELGGTVSPFNILTTEALKAWGAAPAVRLPETDI
jgi:tRNA(adenine34) deaminase